MLRLAEPFFGCHEMEQFRVYSYRFQLVRWTEDRGPTDISGGWPKLTEFLFNIGDRQTGKFAKVPSVVLEQFAANCPALEHLVLPCIDDSTVGAHPDYQPRSPPHRRLKTLLIGHADVECTPEHFAGYLVKLFPELSVPKRPRDCVPYHYIYDERLWDTMRMAAHGKTGESESVDIDESDSSTE
ncbi:hypothetical protein FOMPIDRAFT_1047653 [Fomitopsis schrenkii]|uniref:Uncharacterized protein n=1 Tax=Fomitopsis schrenkii TaxID=2126942 RepID=S8EC88_FOMSC|nr:hypothetical protein FOMPIDRAFT_1047653 [Fomitopsis schrenkii]